MFCIPKKKPKILTEWNNYHFKAANQSHDVTIDEKDIIISFVAVLFAFAS